MGWNCRCEFDSELNRNETMRCWVFLSIRCALPAKREEFINKQPDLWNFNGTEMLAWLWCGLQSFRLILSGLFFSGDFVRILDNLSHRNRIAVFDSIQSKWMALCRQNGHYVNNRAHWFIDDFAQKLVIDIYEWMQCEIYGIWSFTNWYNCLINIFISADGCTGRFSWIGESC